MTTKTVKTREAWLQNCAALLFKRFKAAGYMLPVVHVSVGFPSRAAMGKTKRRIGECWAEGASSDNIAHIFISPILNDVVDVVGTLAHELVHATVGIKAKHGMVFKKCALAVGLAGKMTECGAGEELAAWIKGECIEKLGAFPHPAFDPKTATRIKDGTRMIKVECPACGCVARMTRKWIDNVGPPICSCDGETQMMDDSAPKGEDGEDDGDE